MKFYRGRIPEARERIRGSQTVLNLGMQKQVLRFAQDDSRYTTVTACLKARPFELPTHDSPR
jgi:hypothetical protein